VNKDFYQLYSPKKTSFEGKEARKGVNGRELNKSHNGGQKLLEGR